LKTLSKAINKRNKRIAENALQKDNIVVEENPNEVPQVEVGPEAQKLEISLEDSQKEKNKKVSLSTICLYEPV
jgi:hypothetical protein